MSTPDNTHIMKVVKVSTLAPQIIKILMRPEQPITYTSGDYIMLGFETTDLKPFSIAAAPREDGLIECHIRKQPDNEWMERLFQIQTGDSLIIQGPNNQMQLKPAHQAIVFVAGGTGFAPMKALLEESLRQNIKVPISFYWGARNKADLYMHEWLINLSQQHPHIEYIPVISDNIQNWHGETGLVHKKMLEQHPSLIHTTVYMCGPWDMIQVAKQEFIKANVNPDAIVH